MLWITSSTGIEVNTILVDGRTYERVEQYKIIVIETEEQPRALEEIGYIAWAQGLASRAYTSTRTVLSMAITAVS